MIILLFCMILAGIFLFSLWFDGFDFASGDAASLARKLPPRGGKRDRQSDSSPAARNSFRVLIQVNRVLKSV